MDVWEFIIFSLFMHLKNVHNKSFLKDLSQWFYVILLFHPLLEVFLSANLLPREPRRQTQREYPFPFFVHKYKLSAHESNNLCWSEGLKRSPWPGHREQVTSLILSFLIRPWAQGPGWPRQSLSRSMCLCIQLLGRRTVMILWLKDPVWNNETWNTCAPHDRWLCAG